VNFLTSRVIPVSYVGFSERDFLENGSKYFERIKSSTSDAKARKGTSMEDVVRRFQPSLSRQSGHIDASDPSGYRLAQHSCSLKDEENLKSHALDGILEQRRVVLATARTSPLGYAQRPEHILLDVCSKEQDTLDQFESACVAHEKSPGGSSAAIEEYLSSILRDCHQLEAPGDAFASRSASLQPAYTLEDLKSLCYVREQIQNSTLNEESLHTPGRNRASTPAMDYTEIPDAASQAKHRMASYPVESFVNSLQSMKEPIHSGSNPRLKTAQDRVDPLVLGFDATHIYSDGLAKHSEFLQDNDRDILDSRTPINFESAGRKLRCNLPPKFAFGQASGLDTRDRIVPVLQQSRPCSAAEPGIQLLSHQEELMGPKLTCLEESRFWRRNKLY
jgi:hypothetical protein